MKFWPLVLVLFACTTKPPKDEPVVLKAPVLLRLGGSKGEKAITAYHSDSQVTDFEGGQKTRDHEEIMDFTVATEVLDARANQISIHTEVTDKDGAGDLHDFAFPDQGEFIDFVYSREAKVLRADPFPRESIFYLPPISLPPGPVAVGDTWSMDHVWVSSNDGLPLHLNMVTIVKGAERCVNTTCLDLEVSGQVQVMSEKINQVATFDSHLSGRILFSIERGDVMWSEVKSEERFKTKDGGMHVVSCMSSLLQTGPSKPSVTCAANKESVKVPKL